MCALSLYSALQVLSQQSDVDETWYECYSIEGRLNMVDARVSLQSAYVMHTNMSLQLMQLCSDIYSVGYKVTNGSAVKVLSV